MIAKVAATIAKVTAMSVRVTRMSRTVVVLIGNLTRTSGTLAELHLMLSPPIGPCESPSEP